MSSVMSLPLTDQPPVAPAIDGSAAPAADQGAPQFNAPTMGLAALQRNPQLPQHPLGAYTDSMYEAQVAQLKAEIANRYNDVLQQLGYTNDNGQFVPGQVEIDANKQRSELARSLGLADEQTTQQHQQQGTLFSGLRGTDQARAEYPYQSGLADLNVSVPKQLSDLYGQAGGLVNEFTIRHNLLLADAASRAAANLQNNAAAGGVNATGSSVGDGSSAITDPGVAAPPGAVAPISGLPYGPTSPGGGLIAPSSINPALGGFQPPMAQPPGGFGAAPSPGVAINSIPNPFHGSYAV